MKTREIEKKKAAEMNKIEVKFETAKKIRELLDQARTAYGAEEWDDDDVETAVVELATLEDV